MKSIYAKPESIEDVFSKNCFIIPDFQRPYSWNELQCSQLLSDLISAFEESLDPLAEEQDNYFLGNIIYYPDDKQGEKVWRIVDGQQRLTTLLMLMSAIHANTRSGDEYAILKRLIYKFDKKKNAAIEGEVRLESEVPPGERGYNPGDLKKVLALELDEMAKDNKKNPFLLNYNRLSSDLDIWWQDNRDKWEGFINFLLEKVLLLPIKCESEWDALDLFEIINDRGVDLDDADVFKARFYKAVQAEEKPEFVQRWNDLKKPLDLFRTYMHISKAQQAKKGAYSTKRDKLRIYVTNECLKNKNKPLSNHWDSILRILERCHFYKTNIGIWNSRDKIFSAKEKIYWKILSAYPNESWQFPLFVFMNKHGKFTEGSLNLSNSKKQDYLNLLESTVKFFFMRGIVHNSIDKVRTVSHEVCVRIEQDDLYLNAYDNHKDKKKDLADAKRKLEAFTYGRSYRRGLAFLNSYLNPSQLEQPIAYADAIWGDIHIEHILPQSWREKDHYEEWTKKTHSENFEKAGNLMPLGQKINIKAADSFFRAKQAYYKESDIEDALDLSREPPRWHPEDLEKRHKKAVERLMEFFSS